MTDRLDRRFWWWVGALALVGLALRIGWVVYAAHTPHGLYDPARYLRTATQIAKGKGYVEPFTGKPTAYYPPGYPWFLGVVAWGARHNPIVRDTVHLAGYVQAVLGATTVAAVAVIGRRVASAGAGIVAALLVALYPNLIFHSAALLSETLCIALLCASLAALWWRPAGVPLARWQIAAFAVTFALGVMVRPISLPVLIVIVVWHWFATHDRRQVLVLAGASVAALAVVIGAWTIRNAVRMHAFIPMSTNTGDNLCIGHGPHATGGFRIDPECTGKRTILEGPRGEVAHDKEARSKAWKEIGQSWTREPWLTWRRLDIMFEQDHDGLQGVTSYQTDHWMPAATFNDWAQVGDDYGAAVVTLGIVGAAVLLARRRGHGVALVAITVVVIAVPLAFFGDARFKVPAMPFVAVAAAVALEAAAVGAWRLTGAGDRAGARRRSTP